MNPLFNRKIIPAMIAASGFTLAAHGPALAQLADLADVPLANSPSDAVLPNLMYILDDSGSMMWSYMPDNVHQLSSGTVVNNCKSVTSTSVSIASTQCASGGTPADWGEPPYFSAQFNQIYYNPDITYAPGVSSLGASLGNAVPTAAMEDAYLDPTTTKNLTTTYPEIYYCNTASPTSTQLSNTAICRRNGINNLQAAPRNYFLYWDNNSTSTTVPYGGYPVRNATSSALSFRYRIVQYTGNPYYFRIAPNEYCSDSNLVNCQLAPAAGAAPDATNIIPAPVRYCKTTADAISTGPISGNPAGTPLCRKNYDSTYRYPRYGRFTRVDIVSTTASYPKGPNAVRTDCASAASCTYAEELQNFANWYSYYRTRMAMMKTATGRAFLSIDDRYRVGFITINPGNPVRSPTNSPTDVRYLPIATFAAAQKSAFYTVLYSQVNNGGTPLREALSRVGRYYAGKTNGINSGMPDDPVSYSCQQNFALLTTDGYWNGAGGVQLDGTTAIGNQDNSNSGYSTRAAGAYDGGLSGASNTLADVAMYYYKTDLRAAGWPANIAANNVPTIDKDPNNQQHMVTFTLGLGLKGLVNYTADYESNPNGDFANIKQGTNNACSWTSGACNWPVPAQNTSTALDDLWHAAVNGRGTYYSASDPNTLAEGLSGALSALKVKTAAASASATSSPNITETDNFIYSSTFRTVKWDGEIVAQRIDPTSGNVLPAVAWSAQALLDARVTSNSDTRSIWRFDSGSATRLKAFTWTNMSAGPSGTIAAERPYFENQCTALSQCPLLTPGQQGQANNGQNMVDYLRGQTQFEGTAFRDREHVLGDPVNATPAFVREPRFNFNDAVTPSYASFKTANASRQGVLYIAANDGMLHAFNGDTGQELWAYVPRIVFPRLSKLASDNWDVRHEYYVDGSPQVMDVFDSTAGAWKTILVGGLNKGGRGFYALDVTDPANPKGLWEACSDNTLCEISDTDMGYSFGNPVITKRASDGRWVVLVTSGINNVTPGTGRGYLYVLDAITGAVLTKVDTGAGNTTTPSGLLKISGFANNFNINNTATFVYGGDLLGNVWRFDMSTSTPAVLRLARLTDGSSPPRPQSITSRPELGVIEGNRVIFVGTGRYLGEDDLADPATLGLPWAYTQSFYAFKDKGTDYGDVRFSSPGLVEQTILDSDGITRSTSTNAVDWVNKDGWFVDFNPGNSSPGERVNLDPQLILGTVVVVANVPNNNACTVGGDSWIYQFDYRAGTYVASAPNQQVATKLTGKITVGIVIVRLPSGVFKYVATGATGEKLPGGVNLGGAGGASRRVSWRELIQ